MLSTVSLNIRKITGLEALPEYRLRITFFDGLTIELDFKKKIEQGTATEPLLDVEFFKQVKITQGGRAIEWPGEIDFCADSLWLEGTGEPNPYVDKRAS